MIPKMYDSNEVTNFGNNFSAAACELDACWENADIRLVYRFTSICTLVIFLSSL